MCSVPSSSNCRCALWPPQHGRLVHSATQEAGLRTKVVYSGGVDVDILPHTASKGKALEFLLSEVPPPLAGVQVNGDSGNDIELLAVPGVCGCMVANAHPELREWVQQHSGDHRLFAVCVPLCLACNTSDRRQASGVLGASWRGCITLG